MTDECANRRGLSMVELLVGAVLSSIVVAAMSVVSTGGCKMTKAALSSVAIQNALILQEMITQDLRQLGQDSETDEIVRLSKRTLSFHKTFFDEESIRSRLIRYSVVPTSSGNMRFCRTEDTPSGPRKTVSAAVLRDLEFQLEPHPSRCSRFLNIRMVVLDDDVPASSVPQSYSARAIENRMTIPLQIPARLPDLGSSRSRHCDP